MDSYIVVPTLAVNKACIYTTGGAFSMLADTFYKALCTSLAELKAVHAEAEHAGISLGELPVHLAGMCLHTSLCTFVRDSYMYPIISLYLHMLLLNYVVQE